MSDRELLELAAKAAGIKLAAWDDRNNAYLCADTRRLWNALLDDGDALRLAVRLGLHVTDRVAEVWRNGKELHYMFEDDDDPYAATRRAIVRAAAEIGKQEEQ